MSVTVLYALQALIECGLCVCVCVCVFQGYIYYKLSSSILGLHVLYRIFSAIINCIHLKALQHYAVQ